MQTAVLTIQPSHHWVLYACQDLGVYQILAEDNNAPKTVDYLAQKTNQRTVPNIFISTSYRLLRMQQLLTSPVPLRPEAHRWYVRHAV